MVHSQPFTHVTFEKDSRLDQVPGTRPMECQVRHLRHLRAMFGSEAKADQKERTVEGPREKLRALGSSCAESGRSRIAVQDLSALQGTRKPADRGYRATVSIKSTAREIQAMHSVEPPCVYLHTQPTIRQANDTQCLCSLKTL
jgi:hypothetical protein